VAHVPDSAPLMHAAQVPVLVVVLVACAWHHCIVRAAAAAQSLHDAQANSVPSLVR
jgi:hypothetical protein